MNQVQEILSNAIRDIKAIPKEQHMPKWRSTVVKRLEETIGIASLIENPTHFANQPLPDPPYDPDEQIDLSKINF